MIKTPKTSILLDASKWLYKFQIFAKNDDYNIINIKDEHKQAACYNLDNNYKNDMEFWINSVVSCQYLEILNNKIW